MADVQELLTRKAGPLPVWGWAAAAGGLLSILYLRGKGQTSAAAPAPADGTAQGTDGSSIAPFATAPIIVTPQTMPDSTSSANPSPSTSTSVTAVVTSGQSGAIGTLLRQGPSFQAAGGERLPIGTTLQVNPQVVYEADQKNGWYHVTGGVGAGMWVWNADVQLLSGSGGMGGGGMLKLLPGGGKVGRFTSPHAHPQYLSTRGMGGGPHALKAVSRRTGIPEIRLMALNPRHARPSSRYPDHIHIR